MMVERITRSIMSFLKAFCFYLLDTCFAWFTPKWRREARLTGKAVRKYVNYNSDRMDPAKIAELDDLLASLKAALLAWNREESVRIGNLLRAQAEGLPGARRAGWVECVESIFVILLVFLGIRTYFVQPFRIPTGSMQPSLNGICVHPVDEVPSLPVRMAHAVAYGSSYVDEKADSPKTITGYDQQTKYLLFTETVVTFDDRSTITVPSAMGAVRDYFQTRFQTETPHFEAGDTIIRARVDAGDLVLVNRMAYHFRKPERGETFVFDTRGIKGIAEHSGDQANGSHYIKRLCGVPGDSLTIDSPRLLVNGKVADEWTIRRVMDRVAPYNSHGYEPCPPAHPVPPLFRVPQQYLAAGQTLTLANPPADPNMREYAALGDNTVNSLDSRYWGPVRQYNLVGPAMFSLWPFTWHWGVIH